MRLAIFDLDGTLLRVNSWQAFFWWTWRTHPARAPALLGWLGLRAARLISSRRLQHITLASLRGLDDAAINAIGQRVFRDKLHCAMRSEGRAEIDRRVADGLEPVIATAAFAFLAAPVAAELGVTHVVATQLEVSDGRFTGRTVQPEPRGPAKADAVRARFAGQLIEWERSCAYSDEVEDLPLLNLTGEAIFVRHGNSPGRDLPPHVRVVDWRLAQ